MKKKTNLRLVKGSSNGSDEEVPRAPIARIIRTLHVHHFQWNITTFGDGDRVLGFLAPDGVQYEFGLDDEECKRLARALVVRKPSAP